MSSRQASRFDAKLRPLQRVKALDSLQTILYCKKVKVVDVGEGLNGRLDHDRYGQVRNRLDR